ncbi:MAG: S8 family peptidase [Flavobacteriales bacterium]|jgi:subtilisin family serine protease|nr:S8 family peptidase [Flavobacteriales bacterium]
MNLRNLILLACAWPALALAQTAPDTWWVQFTDKDGTPYSIDAPEAFLSERSIQRRQTQGIAIDATDLPVDPAYIAAVLALGDVQLHNRSKWFNAITIRTGDPALIEAVEALPFVADVRSTRRHAHSPAPVHKGIMGGGGGPRGGDADYGPSLHQIAMLNGHLLHLELDARGEGMLIGVLDSGFDAVDTLDGFADLRARDGIVLTRDLAEPGADVYLGHTHGRVVLSVMAAVQPGQLIGSAPMADYALVRTEYAATEYIVEEDNWVSGAELADSLGCDVLNTSLGYTVFDDSTQNHLPDQLDGLTTRISIAAGMASAKGMVPVQSAGNRGGDEWYFMSAPADAIDILSVGAVFADSSYVWFSGHGPTADGRVKPDVTAMGFDTQALTGEGTVAGMNGTSLSSPVVAGLVACLWQLHPDRTAHDIMHAVRQSASHWTTPNAEFGHGLPNFMAAHRWLQLTAGVPDDAAAAPLQVFPVPFHDRLTVELPAGTAPVTMALHDPLGRTVWTGRTTATGPYAITGLHALAEGAYVVRITGRGQPVVRTVLKDR